MTPSWPRWLYTLFFYLILPLVMLRLLYRAIKAPAYSRRLLERFGFFNAPTFGECIWIHSVSVGETIAAAPIVRYLQQQYPQMTVVVTTMTPTGSERVTALFGDSVFHVYAPYDLPGSIQRFLQRVKPRLAVVMETELWPNTVHACAAGNIPLVLANGRLSEKSAAGYRRLSGLTRDMLGKLSRVAAQTQADGDRFVALGLPAERLSVTGSIKFDVSIDDGLIQQAADLKQLWSDNGTRPIWIAASTHEGEDELILAAFQLALTREPDLLLVLVPRHPERFGRVAALCEQEGLQTILRSSGALPQPATQVIMGDTMGELLLLFGCADIAFVGGSLVERGGHNMLEPAAWGLPLLTGFSDFNFLEISQLLQGAGGLMKLGDSDQLSREVAALCDDLEARREMGEASLSVVEANRGSLGRLLAILDGYLEKS